MKKVCVITAARSEYGLLRWLMEEIRGDDVLELQLVVTGAHLSEEFGMTYHEIENDGFKIDEKVDLSLSTTTKANIVESMGICSIGFAKAFDRLKPDVVVILGDRYELLPISNAALIMGIPIAHISGGDVTEGAIDDQIRNALTMMASIHFPGTKESGERIERMIGSTKNIFCVGEPGLDNFKRLKLWTRDEIARELNLDVSKKWALLTYHPETKIGLDENLLSAKNIINALDKISGIQVIITGANSDFGGGQINTFLKSVAQKNSLKFKFFMSLGQLKYSSVLNEIDFVIGNSSSGIVEAPFLAKPVINIGDRQKGRYVSEGVINSSNHMDSIINALGKIRNLSLTTDKYFGDGDASIKVKMILKSLLINN